MPKESLEFIVNCTIDYGTRIIMSPEDTILFSKIMDRSKFVNTCYCRDPVDNDELYYEVDAPRIVLEIQPHYVFPNRDAYNTYQEEWAERKRKEEEVANKPEVKES